MEENKIKELFSDEAFVNALMELESAEEVQSTLAAKGLNLSLDEINSIRTSLLSAENPDAELSESELENVSGGSITAIICGIIIAAGAIAGAATLGKTTHSLTRGRW